MWATKDGQRVALDGTILPPAPEFGMVGEKAPAIKVSSWRNLPDNQTRCELQDFVGKVVVLMLFQTTCEYSEEDAMPLMAELYQKHKDDPEVQFLSVLASFPQSQDNTLENAVAMCERFNLPIPIGKDLSQDIENTVCKQLKGLGSPWFVMIDKQGVIVLNGMPADIVDRNVINRIKRGEKVMESLAQSKMNPVAPTDETNDDN
jgi:AhpC/TSA family